MHGSVAAMETGEPLAAATVDVWQASTNGRRPAPSWPRHLTSGSDRPAGLYEQQDPNQRDHNLRGVFRTDAQGRYSYYCLRPTPYPVSSAAPASGPAFAHASRRFRKTARPGSFSR